MDNIDSRLRNYSKLAGLGFACICIYFCISSLDVKEILRITGIDYDTLSIPLKVVYLITWETIIACSIMMILNKKLIKDIRDMKKNHKKYFKKYVKFWLISVGIMDNGIASNEEVIRETFKISPIYIYFSSVIFAPIVEELVFRQSIRNIIPNKVIFILVSGLVFGGLHVLTHYSGPIDLLYLVPYCAPGFAFAYMLADSDNILVSMALHFTHNGILIALQFLLLFLS